MGGKNVTRTAGPPLRARDSTICR